MERMSVLRYSETSRTLYGDVSETIPAGSTVVIERLPGEERLYALKIVGYGPRKINYDQLTLEGYQ